MLEKAAPPAGFFCKRKVQVIPPEGDAEFGVRQVLEIYQRSYDPKRPVVCMDEQPLQVTKKTRGAATADPTRQLRVRAGAAVIFRNVPALLAQDEWTEEVASLLESRDADCERRSASS